MVGVNSWYRSGGQNLNFAIACVDVRKLLDSSRNAKVMAFQEAASVVAEELRAVVAQHEEELFHASLATAFESEVASATERLRLSERQLFELYRSPSATDEMVRKQELRYQAARDAFGRLAAYEPEPPQFKLGENRFGVGGNWYIFQILGNDELLVSRNSYGDSICYLSTESTAGLAEKRRHAFNGLWVDTGKSYTYQTRVGSKTVPKLYALRTPVDQLEASFRQDVASPKTAEALAELHPPEPPTGGELAKVEEAREAFRQKRAREEAEITEAATRRRLAIQEATASPKVDRAAKLLISNPRLARKWLADVVSDYPGTPSADHAKVLISLKDPAGFRVWRSGSFSTVAKLISVDVGKVSLQKANGKTAVIPLDRLSKECQRAALSSQ